MECAAAKGGLSREVHEMKKRVLMVSGVLMLVGCDHATKHLAEVELQGRSHLEVIGGVLDLRYTENRNMAFSALRDLPDPIKRPLVLLLPALAMVLVPVLWRRLAADDRASQAALLLVLGGGLGNLLDRVFRGYVIDFIHVHHWPVFNVADILLGVGIGLLLLAQLRRPRVSKVA
jgi:signal peptidase II